MPRETYKDIGFCTGIHRGATHATVLTDTEKQFDVADCIGRLITNDSDGSEGLITAQTERTVTVTLAGGASNMWHTGATYTIYVGGTANRLLSYTWIGRQSGLAYRKKDMVDDEIPELVDKDQKIMDVK